jgi:hypothetical protein
VATSSRVCFSCDGLLTRLVQIAKVGLQALARWLSSPLRIIWMPGMFTLAERGIKLRGKVTLLRSRWRSSLAIDAFISSICLFSWFRVFAFHAVCAWRRRWPLPALKLGEQGGALLLLLAYRPLFGGDIGLNGFSWSRSSAWADAAHSNTPALSALA